MCVFESVFRDISDVSKANFSMLLTRTTLCDQEMFATTRNLAVTKTLAELLKPRSKLPLRVHVNAVRVLAVGKIIDSAKTCVYAEGGVVRKCKGKGKGKGDVETTRRVNICHGSGVWHIDVAVLED